MSRESHLENYIDDKKGIPTRCRRGKSFSDKVATSGFKTQFIKTNTKNIHNGFALSNGDDNFSRRNSRGRTAPEHKGIHKPCDRSMNLQKLWPVENLKKKSTDDFTEQRCNYERLTQQKPEHHQEQINKWQKLNKCSSKKIKCDAIYSKLIGLSDFRMQNKRDCFSDLHHPLQTPAHSNCEYNACLIGLDDDKPSLAPTYSLLSVAPVTTTPYIWRQRILREQLGENDPVLRKSMTSDKSIALTYLAKH